MRDDAPDEAAYLREQLVLLQKENDHLRHQLAQTEETLRSSQERFQSIIEKTPAGVCITNENYIYEYVNPAYCTLYQYDAEELIGQSFMVVVPEAYREAMASLHDRFLQGEAEVRGEWTVVTRDSTQLTILADAARIIGADGQPKKATFVTDITARKQAEDAVRRKNAYLSALNDITVGLLQRLDLNDLLRGVVTQASVLVGTTHGYIYLLEQDSRMMRLRIGIGVHADTPDYPVERGTGVAGMVWQSGKMVIVNDYPAWSGRPAAFTETHVRATVGMPLTSGSEVVGVIGLTHTTEGRTFSDDEIDVLKRFASLASIAIDNVRLLNMVQQEVDERTRTEAALRAAQQAAEAANHAKSAFLSRMSHELRTPLNIILGFVQVMERDTSLSPGQQTNLATVRRSGTHLLSLINAVLELSKIEAGRETLDERSFDLYHMLDGVEEMFRIRAEQKELRLIFERTPDVPRYVVCDESKLRQVLINLLSNAIKFTPEGCVTLAVERRASSAERRAKAPGISTLRFVVEDTGVGIAADELPAIFEEFGQTQSGRRSNEGTGLGMSISRAFVRMLGGDIAVESIPGQGSRFSFTIPVGPGDPTSVAPQHPPRTVVALAPDQPIYRILVADDIEENRLVLQQLLTSVGFEVREASNGREVLKLWEAWEPHLIWMDMRMPEMDGYEATRRIKATPRGQQTPIIALTASAFEEDRAAMREAGCNDIVAKPFEEPQIFERMAHFLGVRFVYQGEGQSDAPDHTVSESSRTVSLTPATLAALPADWRAALAQAAEQGDEEQVVILLEQIREPHPDLAAALMTLVHTMYIDQIATLLAEGMTNEPTTGVET